MEQIIAQGYDGVEAQSEKRTIIGAKIESDAGNSKIKYQDRGQQNQYQDQDQDQGQGQDQQVMGKERSNTKKKKSPVTRNARAGLTFPVGRISRFMREGRYACRQSANASVYMAAVLEYLVAELLDVSGNAARDDNRTHISPRHV